MVVKLIYLFFESLYFRSRVYKCKGVFVFRKFSFGFYIESNVFVIVSYVNKSLCCIGKVGLGGFFNDLFLRF